jgi:hypothetical protein
MENRNGWRRKRKRIEEISKPRTATARQGVLPGCQYQSNVLSNQITNHLRTTCVSRRARGHVGVLPEGSARQTLVALMALPAPRYVWW